MPTRDSHYLTPAEGAFAVRAKRELDWMAFVRSRAVWIVAFVGILAAISSIGNGFAMDDVHIIVENGRVHSLSNLPHLFVETYWPPIEGASLYRPLTMVAFSLEYAIGRGSPLPFHMANIALYALVCAAFFRLLRTIVDLDTAILGAALFAVHPVHTEAVANIVGQAELLVALFMFIALSKYIEVRRRDALEPRDSAAIVALFFLALISKEHALILPALIVASEVLISNAHERVRDRARKVAPLMLAMALVMIGFIVVRTQVIGAIRVGGSNEILDGKPFGQRALTMLNVSLDWLRLLIWPAQLSADYSYPRTRLSTGFESTMIPGIVVIAGGLVLAWKSRREIPLVTFAMLWIAITMAIPSNIIMVTGFVLAERTLFLASGGVTLLGAIAFFKLWRSGGSQAQNALQVTAALLLMFGITRSATRNPAWKDNDALFNQTVEDVPLSSRAHWMLAEHLALSGRNKEGADEMLLAVALGPKNSVGLAKFGAEQLARGGMCSRAMPLFKRALTLSPKDEALRHDAGQCLRILGQVDHALAVEAGGALR